MLQKVKKTSSQHFFVVVVKHCPTAVRDFLSTVTQSYFSLRHVVLRLLNFLSFLPRLFVQKNVIFITKLGVGQLALEK